MTLPRTPRWYHHLEPVTGFVPCEGERHRVTWRRGKFVLENHDLGGEQALLMLGGEPSACLRALRMWRDQFGMPPDLFTQMQTWMGAEAVLAPKELALPRELGMTLSWDRAWRRSSFLGKHGALIQVQLREQALGLFRQHLTTEKQRFGCRVTSGAQLEIVPSIRAAGVTGRMDKVAVRATARLHASWLVDVGPRGIGLVDGAFVVAVEQDSFTAPRVRAVRWDDQPDGTRAPVVLPAVLRQDAGAAWRLAWED